MTKGDVFCKRRLTKLVCVVDRTRRADVFESQVAVSDMVDQGHRGVVQFDRVVAGLNCEMKELTWLQQ